ncbi:hypothetical protein G6F37_012518 [Rhizopus arrhizus]|nr:hypothetical protein G6F38_012715 [Rhizopus arrhizus]KAG1143114.1 hypothetical protein G6F37_012518 [Rhizopus arrhizus]
MSLSILPASLRPGTDLMSKIVARNPKVINIITKALNNSQDEYIVAESEWNDGTRSDLVLEPQSQNLSPIIIEFQHRVDELFLKRAVNYCLEAYERYKKEPILLMICIETLSDGIYSETKLSRVPGCVIHPSRGWASQCFILCQAGLSNYSIDVPLEPFVAFGLFLTQQARSIISAPCNDDPTIKLLYNLANEHYENITGNQLHLVEAIGQMCDYQNSEYEKLLELIDKVPASLLIQTIKSAQSRIHNLKRKYVEIDETDADISEATTAVTAAATEAESSSQQIQSPSSLSYEQE